MINDYNHACFKMFYDAIDNQEFTIFSFATLSLIFVLVFVMVPLVQNYIALLYRLSAISNIQYPSSNPVIGVMELYWVTIKRLMLF